MRIKVANVSFYKYLLYHFSIQTYYTVKKVFCCYSSFDFLPDGQAGVQDAQLPHYAPACRSIQAGDMMMLKNLIYSVLIQKMYWCF